MTIAEDSGYGPLAVVMAPDDQEIGGAFTCRSPELTKAVDSLRDRAEVLDGVDAQATWDELSPEVATGVLPCVCQHFGSVPGYAAVVVIELHGL